jgi:acetyl esterase/lipase
MIVCRAVQRRKVILTVSAVAALGAAPLPGATQTPAPVLPPAPPGVVIRQNVEFLAPGRAERLDLYLPAARPAGSLSPAVVIIHGGGWTGGSKSAGREFNIGTALARSGYVAASIDYQLQPNGRWPTNVHDCKNAVRYFRDRAKELQIDPDRIGVIGGSAGGHLALMVGLTDGQLEPAGPYPGVSSKVSAVVNLYGVTNLRTLRKRAAEPVDSLASRLALGLFGDQPDVGAADLDLGSPVHHLGRHSPPILSLHGTADETVEKDQAGELDRTARARGARHELILLPEIGHTFDLETWAGKPLPVDMRPVVLGFFDRHLKREGAPTR